MHDQPDYYESDFKDDDPRLDLMLDADCDLRLATLWQAAFESEVFDGMSDTAIGFVAQLMRSAYTWGHEDGQDGRAEPCLVDRHWTPDYEPCPAHDRL